MTLKPLISLLACLSLPCGAQTSAVELDRVHVFADLRQNALNDIPASVEVLDAETLKRRAQNHLQDALGAIPNLNWQAGSSRPRYFQIRGVGEDSQYTGSPNPSVGFLIDDVDFSGLGGIASTFDVERVEIFRGPQGTRYGANALAGLISVKTRDPGPDFETTHSASLGSDDFAAIGTVLSGPINDAFGLRIAAQKSVQDGFRRNAFLGRDDTNARNEALLRSVMLFQPSDAFSLRVSAFAVNLANGYDAFSIDNSRITQSDQPGRDSQFSRALSARATFSAANGVDFLALFSAARSRSVASFDGDWGNEPFWGINAPYDFFSDTQRTRLTRSLELRALSTPTTRMFGQSDWVAGVYSLALDEDFAQRDRYNGESAYALDSVFGLQSSAVFAETTTPIGAHGELQVGARFERRRANYRDSEQLDFAPTENLFGGSIAYLHHQLIGSATGYVTLARGYKAGGFNLGLAVPLARREFDAERLLNLEFGLKQQSADGRFSGTLALFSARRQDQQVATSFQADPQDPLTFVFFTDNASRGRNQGLEGSARFRLSPWLSTDAALGLLRTRVDGCVCGDRELDGRAQANAPSVSSALGADWGLASGWFARTEITHRAGYFFSDSHDQRAQPASMLNLRVGYAQARWSASIWARNALDETHAVRGFYFGNEPPDFPNRLYLQRGDPRWIGLSVEIKL